MYLPAKTHRERVIHKRNLAGPTVLSSGIEDVVDSNLAVIRFDNKYCCVQGIFY